MARPKRREHLSNPHGLRLRDCIFCPPLERRVFGLIFCLSILSSLGPDDFACGWRPVVR